MNHVGLGNETSELSVAATPPSSALSSQHVTL